MVEYKAILLGSPRVGKTALFEAIKAVENIGVDEDTSVGSGRSRRSNITTSRTSFDSCTKVVKFSDGEAVYLKVFDTQGQEKYNSLTNQYYRNTRFVLLTFDYNNEQSLRDLQNWLEYVQTLLSSHSMSFAVCLIGLSVGELSEDRPSYDKRIVTDDMVDQFRSFHSISEDLCFKVVLDNTQCVTHLLLQLAKASKRLAERHYEGLVTSFQLSDEFGRSENFKTSTHVLHRNTADADTQTEHQQTGSCGCHII